MKEPAPQRKNNKCDGALRRKGRSAPSVVWENLPCPRKNRKFSFTTGEKPAIIIERSEHERLCGRSSMDRASDSGSECWGFESLRPYQSAADSCRLRRTFLLGFAKNGAPFGAPFFPAYRMKLVLTRSSGMGGSTPAALPASMHLSSQAMFRAKVRMICMPSAS